MKIYIPSCGRPSFLGTLAHLPEKLLYDTTLVVQDKEYRKYEAAVAAIDRLANINILGLPRRIKTIAPTRAYILKHAQENAYNKIVMLDDDLRFDWRRQDDKGKFLVATEEQIIAMFRTIEARLQEYAHVGVLAREGGNRVLKFPAVYNTRMMRVLAYRTDILVKEKIHLDRIPLMEDFDVCLQLLRKRYANCVLTGWVNGQGMSGAAGGCSHFRTLDLHNECANKLAALHPEYVKVVTKHTKGAWGGAERQDVVVAWKKAFEGGRR